MKQTVYHLIFKVNIAFQEVLTIFQEGVIQRRNRSSTLLFYCYSKSCKQNQSRTMYYKFCNNCFCYSLHFFCNSFCLTACIKLQCLAHFLEVHTTALLKYYEGEK